MNKGVARGECLRGGGVANIEWRFLEVPNSISHFSKLISLAEIWFLQKHGTYKNREIDDFI